MLLRFCKYVESEHVERVPWVSEPAGIAYDRMSSAEVSGKQSMGVESGS